MMVCIVIDIGNTATKVALYDNGRVRRLTRLEGHILKHISVAMSAVEHASMKKDIQGVAMASVVPEANPFWQSMIRRTQGFDVLTITGTQHLPVPPASDYVMPERIGADRLANAAGAVARYGAPVIVADLGTAVTIDVVDKHKRFAGGVILPGMQALLDTMHEKTFRLPRLQIGKRTTHAYGRSTESAMFAGIENGFYGMIKGATQALEAALGGTPKLVATGGLAERVLDGTEHPYELDGDLTLFGIGQIFEFHMKQIRKDEKKK